MTKSLKMALSFALVALAGCAKLSNDDGVAPAAPSGPNRPAQSTSFPDAIVVERNLDIGEIGFPTPETNNDVKFDDSMVQKTVVIRYQFNSDSNTRFDVDFTRGASPDVLTLFANGISKAVDRLGSVELLPNTEYSLEVAFKKVAGPQLFQMGVFLSKQGQRPTRAIVCKMPDSREIVMQTNYQSSIWVDGQKFVGGQTYCGKIYSGKITSRGRGFADFADDGVPLAMTYQDKVDSSELTASVTRDPLHRTAVLECAVNGQRTDLIALQGCGIQVREAIMDRDGSFSSN